MTPHGKAVYDALGRQGFMLVLDVNEHHDAQVISRDGRRVHEIPRDAFYGTKPHHLGLLKLIAAGLEIVEGFIAPPELWDL